ncbi:MAG: hypothetical protein ACPHID_02955 [Thermoplasmatota archaeon]
MNRTLVLTLASLIAVTLSGCTGAPAGTAAIGDTATVNWTAFDLHSGAQVASGTDLEVEIGKGQSGLGRDFERHLIGQPVGQTFTFDSEADPSRPYGAIISTGRDQLAPGQAESSTDLATFQSVVGIDPVVGESFEFNGVFLAEVVALDGDSVTFRHLDHTAALDSLGIIVVTTVEDGELLFDLQANPGVEFVIPEPGPFSQGAPLEGLEPGMYRTRAMTETHILYDYSAQVINADLNRPLRFEVTITDVIQGEPAGFSEGGFAARTSPVLLADPAAVTLIHGAEPVAAEDEHDNHDHDGHSH